MHRPRMLPNHALATPAPIDLNRLRGQKRVNLACGIREFPREIFELADTLEVLDLSGNQLSRLPDDLPRLRKLRILFCSNNAFTALPAVLGECPALEMIGFKSNRIVDVPPNAFPPKLRWLILTDNAIETLPDTIGACRDLQKLMLAGNRLAALPATLAHCQRLELIRVAANRLQALPESLLALPRLAWLAFAGNPLCAELEAAALDRHPAPPVSWHELELHERLGEGASGTIYRARRPAHGPAEFAVKLFKGAITSDGLPHSELAACLAAGEHPNRIPALARIVDHPDGTDGLLMPFIDAGYQNLAGPPSLATCTRDVYPAEHRYTPSVALRIAQGIASLAASLHARGIMHGDLYAHNILHCGAGRPLLGDFGAASFVPPDAKTADRVQRIEVRAFGCLLEELHDHSGPADDNLDADTLTALRELAAACQQESVDLRPTFADLALHLTDALSLR